jgi:hypothetical protein
MLNRLALVLLPMLVWAQAPPDPALAAQTTPGAPADVDKALRARVSQFLQYHVDGDFRRAYDLVAEDTKEEYFNSAKLRLKTFEIAGIQYTNDFRDAEVNATVTMVWNLRLQDNVSTVPMLTTWKLEDGKWVWSHKLKTGAALTPMGPSRIDPAVNGTQAPKIPEHIDDAAVAGAAAGIVKQITLNKGMVKLAGDKTSSDKVVVHNGTQGFVRLSLATLPEIPGFSVKFDKTDLAANQDAVLQFEYAPSGDAAGDAYKPPFQVRVVADPFNQVFPVIVNLGEPPAGN